jgi:hypothetical protein
MAGTALAAGLAKETSALSTLVWFHKRNPAEESRPCLCCRPGKSVALNAFTKTAYPHCDIKSDNVP